VPDRVVVDDAGLYLGCSALNRPGPRSAGILVIDALVAELHATLVTSSAVVVEAAQHTISAMARATSTWERDRLGAWFRQFFKLVWSHELAPASVLSAMHNLDRCRREARPVGTKRRSAASAADALTAEVARELHAAILISDGSSDFRALLPDYDFERLSVTDALRRARAASGHLRSRHRGTGSP
jgi:hypothetical protein